MWMAGLAKWLAVLLTQLKFYKPQSLKKCPRFGAFVCEAKKLLLSLYTIRKVAFDAVFADFLDHAMNIGLKSRTLQVEFAGEL